MKRGLMASLLVSFHFLVFSQTNDPLGTFNDLELEVKLNNKWEAFGQLEFRSLSVFDRFYYYEVKAGVSFKASENISFSFAGGLYRTFRDGPDFENHELDKEYKLWQEAKFKQKAGRLGIEHRYRIEEVVNKNFKLNFRYKLKFKMPINAPKIEQGVLYALLADEIFFRDRIPHFKRNRLQAGFGYGISEWLNVEAGYLRQVGFDIDFTRKKNYIFTAFSFNI